MERLHSEERQTSAAPCSRQRARPAPSPRRGPWSRRAAPLRSAPRFTRRGGGEGKGGNGRQGSPGPRRAPIGQHTPRRFSPRPLPRRAGVRRAFPHPSPPEPAAGRMQTRLRVCKFLQQIEELRVLRGRNGCFGSLHLNRTRFSVRSGSRAARGRRRSRSHPPRCFT